MPSNLNKLKSDLTNLIQKGEKLNFAMQRDLWPEEFEKSLKSQIKDPKELSEALKALPAFNSDYESWYSEALVLLKNTLPDRVSNFISFYEKPKNRKNITHESYTIQDYLQGLTVTQGWDREVVVGKDAAYPLYKQQLAILKAVQNRFESSLFDIKQLVQADLFDTELEEARELSKRKFFRAAGVIAGVVLEKHLQQVAIDHNIQIAKKNPTIADLNEALKSSGVIEVPQWRHISMLGDIRNICGHNKEKEPTESQVEDLIGGTEKVIKTLF